MYNYVITQWVKNIQIGFYKKTEIVDIFTVFKLHLYIVNLARVL